MLLLLWKQREDNAMLMKWFNKEFLKFLALHELSLEGFFYAQILSNKNEYNSKTQ